MTATSYAILIGNSQYPNEPDLPDLHCPENDIGDLQALLTSPDYGVFQPENVSVLKNKNSSEVARELHRVITQTNKDDLILIYYSGHGKLNTPGYLHLTTADTEASALEVTSVPTSRIRELLRAYPRNRVVMILDCCFAGNVKKDWETRGGEDALLEENLGGCGTYILAATSANTTAKEKAGDRNGLFTKYLLQGIESGGADRDQKGFITTSEVFDYVNRQIRSEGLQEPKKWAFDISGEEICIARSGREPRQERAERIRKKLLALANEDHNFDDIFMQAREFIFAPENELDEVQQQRDALLEQLDKNQISTHEFYYQWRLLDAPKPPEPEPEPAPPPKPQPKPIPATRAEPAKPRPKAPKSGSKLPGFVIATLVIISIGVAIWMNREPELEPVKPDTSNTTQTSKPEPTKLSSDTNKNTIEKPKMVRISGGTFTMGSPESEKGRGGDEKQHTVEVKDFHIGQYEVTFTEYDLFAEATGRQKPDDRGWGRGNRPVVNVSWNDAMAYINWLNEQTGENYRLPTEAEWEYAARGGTETTYWWGNDIGSNNANCDGCGSQWDNKQTAPVGSFKANKYGLYDTVGNVWEWTCSEYDSGYGGGEKECVSKNRANNVVLVFRGGSWFNEPSWVRAAVRDRWGAGFRSGDVGFRLARS